MATWGTAYSAIRVAVRWYSPGALALGRFGIAVSWSVNTVMQKAYLARYSPPAVTAYTFWGATLALLPFTPALLRSLRSAPMSATGALLYLGLVPAETTGHFVFAPTPGGGAYSRMFAPRAGIAEDPATGRGTGPLAAYMARYRLVPLRDGERFTSTQGVHMGRPSKLHVILHVRADALEYVEVGGSAVRVVDATLTLPA